MTSSRRSFLRSLGVGTAAGVAAHWSLGEVPAANAAEPATAKGSDGFIHLDSNENAYGPSARVAQAIRSALGKVNRYPFRKYDEVTAQIARFHRVKPENVLFACGSTEILRVAACAFAGSGRQLIQAVPTYEAIAGYAKAVGSEVVSVPLNRSFAHDLEDMRARTNASAGLVYICNPNNPTSSLTPREEIEDFVKRSPATTRVLIDEAYHQYVVRTGTYASFIDKPLNDDRVIVTRTFSKVYGLAGLRLGYAVAAPTAIEEMRKFLTADSLNAIIAEVVGVALDDVAGVAESVKRNSDQRQEFLNSSNIRSLKPIDPHANFVMVDVQHPVEQVIEHFRQHNILIGRRFPILDTYMRVSLGTPAEMVAFWKAWDLLPWSHKMIHRM
ncbi:MAG: aminotransferase class I/II-fold pyridoxal phosphate-dependent enzyme [Acidobacteriia bacterium]|nr:aminotransferase class I/II-fold pyridoxal phosphate-dependent enzyme [Terriglobia bacterium]